MTDITDIGAEIARRRTFAIISHPDAGKTTLTEKLLLFSGAIQMAGAVKARGEQRRARSDWLKVERERGISVSASVMSFEYGDCAFNLLDTPGHEDFSEDTYRTLTAVDSAIMVIDAAKGIEEQTRKLFEVCRLRDVPIITFVNKMDREARDPLELIDEIEQTLALDVAPVSWPIGMGRTFRGCYDLVDDRMVLMDRGDRSSINDVSFAVSGLDDPTIGDHLPRDQWDELKDQVAMVRELCPAFDLNAYREGHLTPVFFGSALNNFGVRELLEGVARLAPPPRTQPATPRDVEPTEDKVSGFVFKIQANMDLKHRDRIAFVRLCSGHFKRGMRLLPVGSAKAVNVSAPVMFMAQDREIADEAVAGDIIGIPNHGTLRIGDSLTEGEEIRFTGIPSFAPEMLRRIRPDDPMKAKHLGRALEQLAEEGVAAVLKPRISTYFVVGVVGALQFEVLADRIRTEYGIPVMYETVEAYAARWVSGDPAEMKRFSDTNSSALADDHTGRPVFLARNAWHLTRTAEDWPKLKFDKVKNQVN
ncbi:peptide chain release factor 3 [Tistrella bauzanensis]|uniref:Peptide chain release factor 3 n=1 Tax=Tistrella bauzanensis TaxID=657419 RepID=A0ABQ1J7R9_9PROT|nr:peptide chain release factor 3 [Tistrella bauzanensis]GGB61959.1 peptide chain release factor 3 [Tistrella bauzanensis]